MTQRKPVLNPDHPTPRPLWLLPSIVLALVPMKGDPDLSAVRESSGKQSAGAGGAWVGRSCFGALSHLLRQVLDCLPFWSPRLSLSPAPSSALPFANCLGGPPPPPPVAGVLFWELRGASGGRGEAPRGSVLLCDPGPGPVALRWQEAERTAETHPAPSWLYTTPRATSPASLG